MIILAFILGLIGLLGFIVSICLFVYAVWRRPRTEGPIPSGLYRVTPVGKNKITGATEYRFDKVDEPKEGVQ